MNIYKNYTREQIETIVNNSRSISESLRKLNVSDRGGSHSSFKKNLVKHGINTSHFTGLKGIRTGPKRKLEDYLNNSTPIATNNLKKRLLQENLKTYQCEECGINQWKGERIPLELHHIDGNPKNNNLTNLQILCPNCHSITKNYRGSNAKRIKKEKPINNDPDWRKNSRIHTRKVERPSKQELEHLIETKTWRDIGKQFGVSDNAIKKWAKNYEIQFSTRKYNKNP